MELEPKDILLAIAKSYFPGKSEKELEIMVEEYTPKLETLRKNEYDFFKKLFFEWGHRPQTELEEEAHKQTLKDIFNKYD